MLNLSKSQDSKVQNPGGYKRRVKMIQLSPTALSLFLECPRCFWLGKNERIKRPAGIFPSLPRGMDKLIKDYFDSYRVKSLLPPEIDGLVQGKLLDDQELLSNWRDWRKGLRFEDDTLGSALFGALDDCLVDDGMYMPLDYKTRGYDLNKDSAEYYKLQINSYALLLEKNGYKIGPFGYLVFYIPRKVSSEGRVTFSVEVVKVEAEPAKAATVFEEAVKALRKPIPSAHTECDYCSWLHEISAL